MPVLTMGKPILSWGRRIQRLKEASGRLTGKQWSDATIATKLGNWTSAQMIREYRTDDTVPSRGRVYEEMNKALTRIEKEFNLED